MQKKLNSSSLHYKNANRFEYTKEYDTRGLPTSGGVVRDSCGSVFAGLLNMQEGPGMGG